MTSRYAGILGAGVIAVAAFLLGMSIESSRSTSSAPVAAVQSTPAPPPTLDLSQIVLPTPQPQVVQVEITVKQEPASPQIIEVLAARTDAEDLPRPPAVAPQTQAPQATPRPVIVVATGAAPAATARPASTPQALATVFLGPAAVAGVGGGVARPPAPPTPMPDPCLNRVCASVGVNFAGSGSSQANVQANCNVATGSSAWECVKQALGVQNIQFKDFGGSLGVFISGLYGVSPDFGACSCFWEFAVNGAASDSGVSSYIVRNGDSLSFRIGH